MCQASCRIQSNHLGPSESAAIFPAIASHSLSPIGGIGEKGMNDSRKKLPLRGVPGCATESDDTGSRLHYCELTMTKR